MRPTVADAVARNVALRVARGMPPTVSDPSVWRIVASVLADHASGTPATRTTLPRGGRNGRAGVDVASIARTPA